MSEKFIDILKKNWVGGIITAVVLFIIHPLIPLGLGHDILCPGQSCLGKTFIVMISILFIIGAYLQNYIKRN